MNKGDKFFATWTPDFINGEENMRSQSISRRATWDAKSKIAIKTLCRYKAFLIIPHNK